MKTTLGPDILEARTTSSYYMGRRLINEYKKQLPLYNMEVSCQSIRVKLGIYYVLIKSFSFVGHVVWQVHEASYQDHFSLLFFSFSPHLSLSSMQIVASRIETKHRQPPLVAKRSVLLYRFHVLPYYSSL
jgi:hypothetical protein